MSLTVYPRAEVRKARSRLRQRTHGHQLKLLMIKFKRNGYVRCINKLTSIMILTGP